jgi:pyruvate/2-oxoglutarate dehydrogenase complex dihydrolipoamide dehydrogenase (E3) component
MTRAARRVIVGTGAIGLEFEEPFTELGVQATPVDHALGDTLAEYRRG